MMLCELLCDVEYELLQGTDEIEISKLCNHTDEVVAGSVFVCIRGYKLDGHDFIALAIDRGAVAIVVEECDVESLRVEECGVEDIAIIEVNSTRQVLASMACTYYGYPEKELITIGITGTKGKTTVTYMVKQILENAGHKVGCIGTIDIAIGDRRIPTENTTPESIDIQKYFREMVDVGCKYVVMEVSSQALMLWRTEGILFDIGVFTNIGEDHIGGAEHPDFADYLACKSRLFGQCKVGVGNGDDVYYEQVFSEAICEKVLIAIEKGNVCKRRNKEYIAKDIELFRCGEMIGVSYVVEFKSSNESEDYEEEIQVSMPGTYTVYNSLLAIAIGRQLGVSLGIIKDTLRHINVRGRNEIVSVQDGRMWMIDYAHNAMSLESLLLTVRQYNPKRLICVFGCGGNRSKVRRYEMGEVAGRLADLTIITSDNPRYEEPQQIIDDIRVGLERTTGDCVEIIDRREAISYAISNGEKGDFVVLAGKGHEDYQEIEGIKYPMDDRKMIAEEKRRLCLQT